MSKRIVSDPSQHGWVLENGKWVWNNSGSGGGTGAGMVISETEPADKVEGMQWLNPTNGLVLFWDGEKWLEMPGGVDGADGGIEEAPEDGLVYGRQDGQWVEVTQAAKTPVVTGGAEQDIDVGGETYRVHTFTTSAKITVTEADAQVEFLVVGGGGGGAFAGGGAGGYRTSVPGDMSGGNTAPEGSISLPIGVWDVVIGAGGAYNTQGSPSDLASIQSIGGGSGAALSQVGGDGGSGGGAVDADRGGPPGSPVSGQGMAGGQGATNMTSWTSGGGGGGAGAVGSSTSSNIGGNGGDGLPSTISGNPVWRGGGGAGGDNGSQTALGGQGGGGNAGGNVGGPNTGGGGGGTNGGSGIVIVRYKL